ncbi:outer membrane beta-barrel protein [Runella sp.]|uniref:outer membrane beta-barrel protein n=1 Tax=Runella sp. TaxID=1960881 RepID=UPI003D0A98F8
MKKFSTVLAILSLAVSSVYAQSVEWGLKAGVQTTQFRGEDFEGVLNTSSSRIPEKVSTKGGSTFGYTIGGYVRSTENVFLQGELLISVKGAQLKQLSTSNKTTVQYGQLDIPFSIGYRHNHFEISGGPLLSVQLFANDKLKQFLSNYSNTPLTFSPYKSYAFGYHASIGANFDKIGINLRYLASIQPVSDMYIAYTSAGSDPQLRDSHFQQSFGALQLAVSYRLSR